MDNLPLVSILISCYNKESYIYEAVRSALTQDYTGEIEIIVCDDGSTDNSWEKIQWEFYGYPKVQKFWKENGGTASCRNELIEKSNGVLLQMLDGDDILSPQCIRERVDYWLNHQDAGLIYSDFYSLHETNQLTYEYRPHFDVIDNLNEYICGTNCMISKDAIDSLGGYSSDFHTIEDYHMSVKISKNFNIYHCGGQHYIYRHGESQKTSIMLKESPQQLNDEYRRLNIFKRQLFNI